MDKYVYYFILYSMNTLEDYTRLSLFITKLKKNQALCKEDVKGIKYFRLPKCNNNSVKIIFNELDNQNLYEIKNLDAFNEMIESLDYVIIYNITYTDQSDITELRNYILIKSLFCNINIVAYILGSKSDYFKISHYLMIYSYNRLIYDSIYYYDGKIVKRLQKRNIGILTDFLPLIPIHDQGDFLNAFFEKSTASISYTSEQMLVEKSCSKLINDFIIRLQRTIKDFHFEDIKDMYQNASLIEKCLFCFSLSQKNKIEEKEKLLITMRKYFEIVKQHAACIKQIVENVLFHSAIKQGVLSIRTFNIEKHKVYLESKYGNEYFKNNKEKYLEITISDYSGDILNGNIPDHFIASLSKEYQKDFNGLSLSDFFKTNNAQCEKTWIKYYANGDNLGKHYGLKIFNSLIKDASGIFTVESHSNHQSRLQDYYCSQNAPYNNRTVSMPGTSYSILLPKIDFLKEKYNITDVSLTSDIHIQWSKFLDYQNKEIDVFNDIGLYRNSKDKIDSILRILNCLKNEIHKNIVIQINANDKDAYYAEIACRAIALLSTFEEDRDIPHIVFYNCAEVFINVFINTIKDFWDRVSNMTLAYFQVALMPKEQNIYTVIVPSSAEQTAQINRYICMSRAFEESYFINENKETDKVINNYEIVPFEVLVQPDDQNGMTVFEMYAYNILVSNVQETPLGCKIEDTHMRLGSSIHIDDFYEAELLFGNKLFVSCFAFLLARDIIKMNIKNDIVLFGYASYSEMLLYNTKKLIKENNEYSKINVESLLMDREADNRGTGHVDLLRKSSNDIFKNESTVIFIVPINSTMKTLGKMRDKIVDKFPMISTGFIAFTLITIAPTDENCYWKFGVDRIITPKNHLVDSFNKIKYYITAETTYYEAVRCELCYPSNPIHEKPLIEVNASSTIPNQSFQLIKKVNADGDIKKALKTQLISISNLKNVLLYGHTHRGENHFLYYIKTEAMYNEYKTQIENWIRKYLEASGHFDGNENIFNIIFCPMHSSNVDFVEMVNDVLFHGAAMVIRVDVDKEYRSNFRAKFSNLSKLVENLQKKGTNYSIRIHYIDDTIITGRTYHRSKSMITSLFVDRNFSSDFAVFENVKIFYSVILLINRNSSDSLLEYEEHFVDKTKSFIFIFLNLRIPSIRTHGDSCILCNLKRDASILCTSASTQEMDEYWSKKLEKSFREIKVKDFKNHSETKPILRLICTHMAGEFLPKLGAYNSRKSAMSAIIKLINTHLSVNDELSDNIKMDSTEIFYSYIKVISRPFLSFDKFIKEAIFDLLLILIEAVLDDSKNDIEEYIILIGGNDKNNYHKDYDLAIITDFNNMLKHAKINLYEYNEDLLMILMKQLTELKSNYVIRVTCMNKIINYIYRNNGENKIPTKNELNFINFYAQMVKRLVGIGSDTSKSVWLDYILLYGHEQGCEETLLSLPMMKMLVNILMVENTRVYFDAIDNLSKIKELAFNYESFHQSPKELYLRLDSFLKENTNEKEQKNFYELLCGNSLIKCIVDDPRIKSENHLKILEYLKERFEFTYIDSLTSDKNVYENDLNLIINNINSGDYIYENFRKVIRNLYNYNAKETDANTDCKYYFEKDKKLEQMIVASVHLLRFIHFFDEETISLTSRYRKLAIIIRELLDAYNVSIIIQNDVSLNSWISELKNKAIQKNILIDDAILPMDNEYEYIILSSSNTLEHEDEEYCPKNMSSNLKQYIENGSSEFYISNSLFIWKIDLNSKHPIFIYADFSDNRKDRIVNAKCLMMMRNRLRKTVFGTSKNDYIHELVQERNELAIQRRNKSHTHTNNSAQRDYYNKSLSGNSEDEKLGIIMILLADLAVSETYRQSLTKDFYLYNINFFYSEWKDSLFKKINTFVYSDNKKVEVVANGNMPNWHKEFFPTDMIIEDSDMLITLCTPANEQKPLYFLLAMAQNALKVPLMQENLNAKVYITKTYDNNIRICNIIEKTVADEYKEKIIRSISTPPVTRDQGITMWSVSRFIKEIKILAANKYIEHVKSGSFQPELLKKLFSEEFCIKVTDKYNESICCLSIEVQFLKEKFKPFLVD